MTASIASPSHSRWVVWGLITVSLVSACGADEGVDGASVSDATVSADRPAGATPDPATSTDATDAPVEHLRAAIGVYVDSIPQDRADGWTEDLDSCPLDLDLAWDTFPRVEPTNFEYEMGGPPVYLGCLGDEGGTGSGNMFWVGESELIALIESLYQQSSSDGGYGYVLETIETRDFEGGQLKTVHGTPESSGWQMAMVTWSRDGVAVVAIHTGIDPEITSIDETLEVLVDVVAEDLPSRLDAAANTLIRLS